MSELVKRLLRESTDLNEVLPVIESTKPVAIYVCPHCKQEIFEKHSYVDENGVDRHSNPCNGAFKWPEPDWSKVPEWMRPPGLND